jgi:ssDNA-binding Zn-finger/Zn-ribbon topoisomerase 1
MNTLVTLTGSCPDCGHTLKLCQAKAGLFYIGCSDFPRCAFKCPYDPILQQLRDRNARLEAELTLMQMQHTSCSQDLLREPEARRRQGTTWREVAPRGIPPSLLPREARS